MMTKKRKIKNEKGHVETTKLCRLIHIPTYILHDILFKLPLISIMKLKLVCKSMKNLINHPDFSLDYSNNSPFTTLIAPTFPRKDDKYKNFDLFQVFDTYECFRTPFRPFIPNDVKEFTFAGSCNGLVCLSVRNPENRTDVVYVCNPILGQIMALPKNTITSNVGSWSGSYNFTEKYAFGFCASTNNYKVLRLICRDGFNLASESWKGSICTVGLDREYRALADPKIPFSRSCGDIVAHNGCLYWIVKEGNSMWISTFYLNEENVGSLPHPSGLVLNSFHMRLRSINNHLFLVDRSDSSQVVLWKMDVDGVEETSWTKDMILDISLKCNRIYPDAILPNGDILFSSESRGHVMMYDQIMLYNRTKKKLTETMIYCYAITSYAPRLLPFQKTATGLL